MTLHWPGRWIVATAFWTLVTLLAVSQNAAVTGQEAMEAGLRLVALVWQATYFLLWIPFTVAIWRISDLGTPEDLGWPRFVVLHLVLAIVIAVGQAALTVVMAWVLAPPPGDTLGDIVPSYIRSRLAPQVVVYAAALATAQAMLLASRWRDGEAASARLEAQLAQARLAALGAQLHPHVLFNSLHAIAALVREGRNAEAVQLISGMSDLLRQMLDTGGGDLSLEDELTLVRRFLDIQQVRFDNRLQVTIDADPRVVATRVPALTVQPLVENAIRHGLAERVEAGRIAVRASLDDETVVVTVEDDGDGVPDGWTVEDTPGTGLRTLRERLDAFYRGRASVDVESAPGRGCRVRLRLPIQGPVR